MIWRRKRKIAVYATWNDGRGKEKTVKRFMESRRKANMIRVFANGVEIRVRVEV